MSTLSPDQATTSLPTGTTRSLFENPEELARANSPTVNSEDFSYRPLTPLAPISLFLGLCSFAGLLGVPAMSIGVVGALCGLLGLWLIRRSDGNLSGKLIAQIGLGLSVVVTVSAGALHAHTYVTEVPEGHERVTFSWLSDRPPVMKGNDLLLPPDVIALNEKSIFIKGYMYPTRQKDGLKEFVLVKDTGDCCFGRQPKLSDMVVVHLQDGKTVKFREAQLVSVAGTFRITGVQQAGDIVGLYALDGTHFQ